jgi:hypothetical protein
MNKRPRLRGRAPWSSRCVRLVVIADPARTAIRPLRVQGAQSDLVERVDDVADRVLVRSDQPRDRRHRPRTPTPMPMPMPMPMPTP